jgi:hypothetical protein
MPPEETAVGCWGRGSGLQNDGRRGPRRTLRRQGRLREPEDGCSLGKKGFEDGKREA